VPTTAPTTLAPTMETNIPDPSVDTGTPDTTDTSETRNDEEGVTSKMGGASGKMRGRS
jgi:hypothetical protein